MTKYYIYVMDYYSNAIYEIECDETENDNVKKLLEEYGLDINTCRYMYSSHKLNIEKINKI